MKIAQVTAFWGPAYPTGTGTVCYELSKRLAKQNEVHVYTSDVGNFHNSEEVDNLYVHPLHTYITLWNMNPLANVFTKLLRSDFDIVHVHSYIFFLSNMAALARVFKRSSKYLLQFHGGLSFFGNTENFYRGRIWVKENIYDKTLGYFTARMADKVISCCKRDIPIIQRKFGIKEVEWIPSAVDTEKFTPPEVKPNPPVVAYVGKLEMWKGIDILLKSFEMIHRQVGDAKFLIVGAGSLESKLRELDLPIEFAGHVTYDEMPGIYQRTSILLLPSYMEGFPVTCSEALSCEVPVVATDVGDISEVIIDGVTGRITKPGDFEGIALNTIQLLKEEKLRMEMGRKGRTYVKQNFSHETIIKMVSEIYEELI